MLNTLIDVLTLHVSAVWLPGGINSCKENIKLHKRPLLIVLKRGKMSSYKELFTQLKIMTVPALYFLLGGK